MEYKHFSHPHCLTFQELQNGPQINCSGCKSPVTGSIYICWQCSFFLHEQCYRASRALNHHSHPSHPLTLIPYPTYPSGSFICNSCNQTGTGFSFSCSNCDFDLHVHCAYNSQTTSHQSSYPFVPTQNFSLPPNQNPSFHSQFPFTHESSYPNAPPNLITPPLPLYPPETYPNFPNPNHSLPNAQYPFITQTSNHEPIFNKPPNETVQSFNAQMGPQSAIHGPNFQHQHPLPYEAVPSFNAQMRPENIPLPSNSNNKPNNVSVVLSGENQQKLKGVKHFSHHHALLFSEIKQVEDGILCSGCEQKVSGGSAYTCTVSNCNFNLHNSCFGLPREIKKHKSHPEHTLSLLSIPPYEDHHQFTCNACLENGGAFVYNCSTCNFDLHVECAFLPETMDREDHEHSLVLLYSTPFKKAKEYNPNPNMFFSCDVCRKTVDERCWLYYCQDCDFGTHLGCITSEQSPEEEEKQPSQPVSELATMLETQAQLQRLQLEMQMSQQTAQLIASMGQSVLNLV